MTMYVDIRKCAADAQIQRDFATQYNLGVLMTALGVSELTGKTLPEFRARLEFYRRLSEFMQPDEAEDYWKVARESVGVKVNCIAEKRATWVKRIAINRFDSILRDQEIREKEAQEQDAQLPLAV